MSDLVGKNILVTGTFTEDDWAELLRTIRNIEQRHQEEVYCVSLLDGDQRDRSIAQSLLERTFPRVEDGELEFSFIPNEGKQEHPG